MCSQFTSGTRKDGTPALKHIWPQLSSRVAGSKKPWISRKVLTIFGVEKTQS